MTSLGLAVHPTSKNILFCEYIWYPYFCLLGYGVHSYGGASFEQRSPQGLKHYLGKRQTKGRKHNGRQTLFFLVLEPLRSGYPSPLNLNGTHIFIAWKWSKMDKLFITFFCWSILISTEHNMQFFYTFFLCFMRFWSFLKHNKFFLRDQGGYPFS